jgi:predicted MFS family arabinose efflux permease
MNTNKQHFWPFLMWFFPALFFAYQFILRLWPGLMMQPIMAQFSIDASQFGLLAACYYYGYAGMQIPVAILLERFGARSIVFLFALLCGLATWLFSYTNHFYLALLSRFLIGAGSAVGFLGVSKVVSEWFPKEKYARMIGFSFTFGLLGAIYGGKPVSLLIDTYSWRHVASTLAIASIAIGVLTYLILRSPILSGADKIKNESFKISNMKAFLSSPTLWCLAIANLLMVGSLEGFADVWGVPYLTIAYGLSKADAAGVVSFIFFGMLAGGPFLALCSRRVGDYAVIMTCGLGMALIFIGLLVSQGLSVSMLSAMFFCVGVMCCYQVIVFSAGSKLVTAQQLGVTVAFLNCINMLGGSFFHTLIGKFMDMSWQGQYAVDGLKIYHLEAYQHALSVIPVCAILGATIVFLIRLSLNKKKKY